MAWLRSSLLVAVLLAAGCISGDSPGKGPNVNPPLPAGPVETTLWLAQEGRLVGANDAGKSGTWAVPAGQNAFVNEDLSHWKTDPFEYGWLVEDARIHVFYSVTETVGNPFTGAGGGGDARLFIVWLGSDDALPAYAQQRAPAVLNPGQVYSTQFSIPLGEGFVVGPGRNLTALPIATASHQEDQLRIHWGSDSTATRLELSGRWLTQNETIAATDLRIDDVESIAGNTGMFAGEPIAGISMLERTLDAPKGAVSMRIEVRETETKGPKADLDLYVEDPDGETIVTSTTPFQTETAELWAPHAEAFERPLHMRVVAYSGTDTSFRLRVLWGYGVDGQNSTAET